MTSTKQLTANGGLNKGDTRPRTAGSKSLSNKLPARASSSAPDKVKKITVCQDRDALALVQVTAALAIPANLSEETKEAVLDGAHALYLDFHHDGRRSATEAYDRRRARKQTVNVGQVKVEAGGQAVVGNVTSGPSVDKVTSAPSEVPPAQEMLPLEQKIEDPTPPRK
jgi:hypothetical protein